ncbi:MAG: UDP-N-acetylmuramoyl-L-alanine--D-glutamate ligase [Bacteroidales bacterium]|nr:UDP-N-acetylmuramoyl-L-alanine--D-glutamate ligase [Bacteroidales bacterium]
MKTQENQSKFEALRRQYPLFVYRSFNSALEPERLHIRFYFSLCNAKGREAYAFRPELDIPLRAFFRPDAVPQDLLENMVFHCGMVELVSYWKCACSPQVRIDCGKLDPQQADWFKKLYFLGLGEFFYLNGIRTDRDSFMEISCAPDAPSHSTSTNLQADLLLQDTFQVPVGGGKDSVVTLEILREAFPDRIRPMIINPRGATRNCCLQAGFEDGDCLVVNRSIDKTLLELNTQGFLNGHTPFSAMLAFTSLLTAALNQSRHIALSNENSANESTVPGMEVNHQYSKSLEFENDFRQYVEKYISPQFNYFSFLRPLSELGIARLFASLPQYHSIFRSCNAGSKTDSWCGKCPKCLFAFIILAPFMGIEKIGRLFGKNLLNDPELIPFLDELSGLAPVKPFECVGTLSEVNWALQQLKDQAEKHCLLRHYFSLPISKKLVPESILEEFSSQHNLTEAFSQALQNAVEKVRKRQDASRHINNPLSEDAQAKFRPFFEKARTIAIVGLGREGLSSFALIRRLFPEKPLFLVDANPDVRNHPLFAADRQLEFATGQDYLAQLRAKMPAIDLVLKTPGVSFKDYPDLLQDPKVSSQTDLFLRAYSQQIIGITGTKGKSTTTLLTHHLLSPFQPCVPAGNMGIPLFDIIDEISERTCIVCEFSAHQLEQAKIAPHIGVLLNLFEEHLDHYQSFEAYQNAKMNLADARNIFIYHADDPLIHERMAQRSDLCRAMQADNFLSYRLGAPVNKGLYCQNHRILTAEGNLVFDLSQPHPLVGQHNVLNLMAALLAAHATGVPYEKLATRIASFTPLPHRLQYVGCIEGRHFFNDSISTIPQAAIEAVKSVENLPFVRGVDCLILGGIDRGIDYSPLVDFFEKHPVANLVLVGAAGKRIGKMLSQAALLPDSCLHSDDYKEIASWSKAHTRPGCACVLSPAAASYDQFKNFAERGETFMRLIRTSL